MALLDSGQAEASHRNDEALAYELDALAPDSRKVVLSRYELDAFLIGRSLAAHEHQVAVRVHGVARSRQGETRSGQQTGIRPGVGQEAVSMGVQNVLTTPDRLVADLKAHLARSSPQ